MDNPEQKPITDTEPESKTVNTETTESQVENTVPAEKTGEVSQQETIQQLKERIQELTQLNDINQKVMKQMKETFNQQNAQLVSQDLGNFENLTEGIMQHYSAKNPVEQDYLLPYSMKTANNNLLYGSWFVKRYQERKGVSPEVIQNSYIPEVIDNIVGNKFRNR